VTETLSEARDTQMLFAGGLPGRRRSAPERERGGDDDEQSEALRPNGPDMVVLVGRDCDGAR
jgi:hypothetical protein